MKKKLALLIALVMIAGSCYSADIKYKEWDGEKYKKVSLNNKYIESGFQDKNGVYVCVGDIVEVRGFPWPMEIVWDSHMGIAVKHPFNGSFSFDYLSSVDTLITGNIEEWSNERLDNEVRL